MYYVYVIRGPEQFYTGSTREYLTGYSKCLRRLTIAEPEETVPF